MTAALYLAACGKKNEVSYYYHEEEVHISVGESAEMKLKNLPAGKTAADYQWTITGDTANVSSGIVTGVQTHPSKLSGKETVTAKMTSNGVDYTEVFMVVVEKNVDAINLKYPSITLLVGDEMPIKYTTEPETLSYDQKVLFTLSDENTAEISGDDVLKALSAGNTVLTAKTGGIETSCEVHIFDEPKTADEKLQYINSWQDSFSEVGELNDTVTYEREKYPGISIPFSDIPKTSGTKGSGKYIVVWEWTYTTTGVNSYTKPVVETTATCEFTAALPKNVRPVKWSDAEFMIHIKQGEYIQQGTYEKGIKAMLPVVDITLENMDGDVIETLGQIYGELPDKIALSTDVDPVPEAFYGSFPEESKVRNALSEMLKNLK
ncbi:MAG: hypothetical protein J6O50_09840 [Ruminiclostridium sp.]|nr:hypothetical protein [Ruminiclostridium sp.]